MSGTDTFFETLAEYLTIRIGQASLSPAETVILVLTLAAALLSASHLWRIGRQEDRRDRLQTAHRLQLPGGIVEQLVVNARFTFVSNAERNVAHDVVHDFLD